MTYKPENLERWTLPDYYAGAEWPEYFVFLGRHRDSDLLSESNFARGLELIGGESETVQIVREGHWAVGWIEWIAIHESDAAALETADEIAGRMQDYPVVDESHWSEMEYEAAWDYWRDESLAGRMQLCREAGISPFAARRDYVDSDQDPNGALCDTLREIVAH